MILNYESFTSANRFGSFCDFRSALMTEKKRRLIIPTPSVPRNPSYVTENPSRRFDRQSQTENRKKGKLNRLSQRGRARYENLKLAFRDKDSFEHLTLSLSLPLYLLPSPFFSPVVEVVFARAATPPMARRTEESRGWKKTHPYPAVSFYITGELESKRRERASMLKRLYKVP